MINAIQESHSKGILHRDLKPDNFCISTHESDLTKTDIKLIDFGLSKSYLESNGTHIPYKENKKLVGTCRYVSLATHLGIE